METETKPPEYAPAERSRVVLRFSFSGALPLIPPPVVRVGTRGTALGREPLCGVAINDPRLSRHHATLHSSPQGQLFIVDNASKNGTFVNGVRVEQSALTSGDVISAGDSLFVVSEEPPEEEGSSVPGLLGDSAVIRRARAQVRALAPTNRTVMLVAETGSGKEVAARALHAMSGVTGRFVAVNCAAIPTDLFESQMFGHTAKAFTGAASHEGFFRAASGGTLFLDELGELPLGHQPRLLRAIEERAVIPLGSTTLQPCPVRLIAATNRDLARDVEDGTFRADLLARLFEATVPLPPLRERREDVLTLFCHALGVECVAMTHSLASALLLHDWPFNVRELVATARDIAAKSGGTAPLDGALLQPRVSTLRPTATTLRPASSAPASPRRRPPGRSEALSPNELREKLAAARGTVSEVARLIGRSRRQVYRWIEKYGISVDEFRP